MGTVSTSLLTHSHKLQEKSYAATKRMAPTLSASVPERKPGRPRSVCQKPVGADACPHPHHLLFHPRHRAGDAYVCLYQQVRQPRRPLPALSRRLRRLFRALAAADGAEAGRELQHPLAHRPAGAGVPVPGRVFHRQPAAHSPRRACIGRPFCRGVEVAVSCKRVILCSSARGNGFAV